MRAVIRDDLEQMIRMRVKLEGRTTQEADALVAKIARELSVKKWLSFVLIVVALGAFFSALAHAMILCMLFNAAMVLTVAVRGIWWNN